MSPCLTKTLLLLLGFCLLMLLTAGLLQAQTPTPLPAPSKPSATQTVLANTPRTQAAPAPPSPPRPSRAQLEALEQNPLIEISRLLSRPPSPFAYDFTIDAYTSSSLPALTAGPLELPRIPEFRTEGRLVANGWKIDIHKQESVWSDGKWRPGNESRQLCDGKRFWSIQRPPTPGLWCPKLVFDQDSLDPVLQALVDAGGAIGGHFSFFPKGDWMAIALQLPPGNVQVSEDPVGGFPCRKVWFHLGKDQFTFWVDMKRGGVTRQARVIVPGTSGSRWKYLLPNRRAGVIERTVFELRDVEFSKIANRYMAVTGTTVRRIFYLDGKRECRIEHFRRFNITMTPDLTAPGVFRPGLPEGTVVDLANTGLKYVWRGGNLAPFLDPAVVSSIAQSVRQIAREAPAAPAPLLRGFPLISPDAASSPTLAGGGQPLPDKHCDEALGPRDGLYCIDAAVQLAGLSQKPEALFRPEYLDKGKGSSLPGQLAAAAMQNGLHATEAAGLTARSLAASPWPILLRVKSRPYRNQYDAWELYLGAREGQAWIWNPAQAPRLEPFSELGARWDGSGIVLSRAPIGWLRLRSPDIRLAALVGCLLVLILWRVRRLACGRGTAQPAPGFFRYLRRASFEGLAFGMVSLAVALLWHSLAGGGTADWGWGRKEHPPLPSRQFPARGGHQSGSPDLPGP